MDNSSIIAIDKLTHYERNPRIVKKTDIERLKKQITRLGVYKPLLIDQNNVVLGGNQRLHALKALGHKEVWVSRVEPKTEAERLEYVISDNDAIGVTDEQLLAELVTEFGDIDLQTYKYASGEPFDLKTLLSKFGGKLKEDDVPSLEENPLSKVGEIYELGVHRLMCGDSTNIEALDRLMEGNVATMTFTDPPYNVGYETQKHDLIINDKMEKGEFKEFLRKTIDTINKHTRGAVYICMSTSEMDSLKIVCEESGMTFKDVIIWVKNHATITRGDYQRRYESIIYCESKNTGRYIAPWRNLTNVWENLEPYAVKQGDNTLIRIKGAEIKIKGEVEGEIKFEKRKNNVWWFDKPVKSDEHPTMKPVGLCGEAIRNSSIIGDVVLDLFGGSGSTLIACEQTERKCYMVELDPKYVDVIRKRYAKFIGKEEIWQEITPLISSQRSA